MQVKETDTIDQLKEKLMDVHHKRGLGVSKAARGEKKLLEQQLEEDERKRKQELLEKRNNLFVSRDY